VTALLGALVALAAAAATAEPPLRVFQLESGRILADAAEADAPLAVGSLQKPFVLRAWCESHPAATSAPVSTCAGGRTCWLARGHGRVGLARATALSCNAYFRGLAADTPPEARARALREAGFVLDGVPSADGAIGLVRPGEPAVAIAPGTLLRAYAALVTQAWSRGEPLRLELLDGLRAAADDGTAAGLAGTGVFAKTGTAPSVEGRPLATTGLAIVLDGVGGGRLGVLPRGTGRDAARALAAQGRGRPAQVARASDRVRVEVFSLLRPRHVSARNVGSAPLVAGTRFVGPDARIELRPGDRLAEGAWELRVDERRAVRELRAAVEVSGGDDGRLRLVAEMDPMEYVRGVAAAELSSFDRERVVALGAAALRFLRDGARHAFSDVCDSTHCAYFVGRGPRLDWTDPAVARPVARRPEAPVLVLDADVREAIREAAGQPGPSSWTSHCGGAPLSPHAVWGTGDTRATLCPRHGPSDARPWTREYARSDVESALGPGVRDLRVVERDGTWRLRVERATGTEELLYDEAHRRLARVLGWGALPSPADAVAAGGAGFVARGRGLGHRVGLCLAE
jgi:hypothetical protein